MTFVPDRKSVGYKGHLTNIHNPCTPVKNSDVISLKYTDIRGGSLDWISGFQSGFLDFKVDFWISDWISGFQIGFLDFVGFLDFRLDFCRQCTRFLSWRTPRSHTNRKRSSFATKHFQRKSLKNFDLYPPLKRLVSFVARIIA